MNMSAKEFITIMERVSGEKLKEFDRYHRSQSHNVHGQNYVLLHAQRVVVEAEHAAWQLELKMVEKAQIEKSRSTP